MTHDSCCIAKVSTSGYYGRNYKTFAGTCFKCRIRTEKHGGAWCPRPQVGKDVYEWLEIDLGELKVITLVETQGRFGNGQVSFVV